MDSLEMVSSAEVSVSRKCSRFCLTGMKTVVRNNLVKVLANVLLFWYLFLGSYEIFICQQNHVS